MESKPIEVVRPATSAAVLGVVAFVLSSLGLLLCAVLAFGFLALPVLDRFHAYSYVGFHDLDFLALVVGLPGPLFAAAGVVLGWWTRRVGRQRGTSTRLATAAVTVGLTALALVTVAWAVNGHVAHSGNPI